MTEDQAKKYFIAGFLSAGGSYEDAQKHAETMLATVKSLNAEFPSHPTGERPETR